MRLHMVGIGAQIGQVGLLLIVCNLYPSAKVAYGQVDDSTHEIAVNGSATNTTGTGLGGVLVQAINETGTLVECVITQKDGSYSLHLVRGTYLVRGLIKGQTIADEQLNVAESPTPSSRLVSGVFFKGNRNTVTRGGPTALNAKGQIVRIFYATDRLPSPATASYG